MRGRRLYPELTHEGLQGSLGLCCPVHVRKCLIGLPRSNRRSGHGASRSHALLSGRRLRGRRTGGSALFAAFLILLFLLFVIALAVRSVLHQRRQLFELRALRSTGHLVPTVPGDKAVAQDDAVVDSVVGMIASRSLAYQLAYTITKRTGNHSTGKTGQTGHRIAGTEYLSQNSGRNTIVEAVSGHQRDVVDSGRLLDLLRKKIHEGSVSCFPPSGCLLVEIIIVLFLFLVLFITLLIELSIPGRIQSLVHDAILRTPHSLVGTVPRYHGPENGAVVKNMLYLLPIRSLAL